MAAYRARIRPSLGPRGLFLLSCRPEALLRLNDLMNTLICQMLDFSPLVLPVMYQIPGDISNETGPGADIASLDRRREITKILVAVRAYEYANDLHRGIFTFPTATWFALWLSDMSRLKTIAQEFVEYACLAFGRYKQPGSFKLVTMCGLFLSY